MEDEKFESANIEMNNDVEAQDIITVNKFILLSILSFGLYGLWWMYESWKFFKQKERLDIYPVARTIFFIFFLDSFLDKTIKFAKEKGYEDSYSNNFLFVGYFLGNLSARLADPYWLISIFSFVFLIPPFKALNFAKQHSKEIMKREQTLLNGKQIIILILGLIIWILALKGLGGDNLR